MPYAATVLRIMIASPGDVSKERQVVRAVIHEWNSIHSEDERIVLMPVGWDTDASPEVGDRPQELINRRLLRSCDLLIAAFWTRLGSPTGNSPSGTVEEIEEHVSAGKPAMIYFSTQPVQPDSIDQEQYRALLSFRDTWKSRGLFGAYESLSQFREMLTRQLAQTIIREFAAHRRLEGKNHGGVELPILKLANQHRWDDEAVSRLSNPARTLLREALQDKNGIVMKVATFGGLHIETNGRDLNQDGGARSDASWIATLKELVGKGLIEDRTGTGEIFYVTNSGFELFEAMPLE